MKHRFGRNRKWVALSAAFIWLGIFTRTNTAPSGSAANAMSQGQEQQSLAEQGGKLFNPTCSSSYCHGPNGADGSAPTLRGRNFTADHVTRVISEGVPGTPMPAFKNQYSPEQI